VKTNKLRALLIAACCVFSALWAKIECMEGVGGSNPYEPARSFFSATLENQTRAFSCDESGKLYRVEPEEWTACTKEEWEAITFKMFKVDSANTKEVSEGEFSYIEIPKDGMYTLRGNCRYYVKQIINAVPGIAIAIDDPKNHYTTGIINTPAGMGQFPDINITTRLKAGNKVMLSILGHTGVMFYPGDCKLHVEQLS